MPVRLQRHPSAHGHCLPVLAAAVLLGFVAPVRAALLELYDENARALIATSATDAPANKGLYSWAVNGEERLRQDWFWYRVGNTGAEQSIDTLSSTYKYSDLNDADPRMDSVKITYAGSGFTLAVLYTLTGDPNGGGVSDLSVSSVRITNTSGAPLAFHLFQYADFNLTCPAADETAQIVNGNTVYQTNGQFYSLVTAIAAMTPSRYEVGLATDSSSILSRLTDTVADNLDAAVPGPVSGDVVWAFQWDLNILAGQSVLLSENSNMSVANTPEPGTIGLLIMGSLGLAGAAWRRRRNVENRLQR